MRCVFRRELRRLCIYNILIVRYLNILDGRIKDKRRSIIDRICEPKRKDDDARVVEERGQKFLRRIREVTNRNKRSNYSKRRLIFVVMKGKEA